MGYQALLFCPDEKTARTVTQVLGELDFAVTPCTEPFAAVKKLMAEHFDAVVVDCDNEQNATLLFKSARNSPNNQTALAVAVVEGQAGVAKAFRIGANLVLTKPINVEQAKGTLRVARGLLRKNEVKPTVAAAKPASIPSAPGKPATTPAGPTGSTLPPPMAVPTSVEPTISVTAFAASAANSPAVAEDKHTPVSTAAPASPVVAEIASPYQTSIPEPKTVAVTKAEVTKPEVTKLEIVAPSITASPMTLTGAASAPAPAREKKAEPSVIEKVAEPIPAIEPVQKDTPIVAAAAPSFTFGGTVDEEAKNAGGSNKTLIAVAAILIAAVGGYGLWSHFANSDETSVSVQPAARPIASQPGKQIPAASTSAPSSIGTSTPSNQSAPIQVTQDSIPESTGTPKASSAVKANSIPDNSPTKSFKTDSASESSKPDQLVASSKASTSVQPIMVKTGSTRTVSKADTANDAAAPAITGMSAENSSALPNLMNSTSGAPAPVLQALTVSQGVSQGLVLKRTSPSYPPNALRLKIEGAVQLLATISKTGSISTVKVLSGDTNLARAAVDAVKQWKYKPYLLDGAPVEIQTQITVNFKLPK
jgi:TonB family protein